MYSLANSEPSRLSGWLTWASLLLLGAMVVWSIEPPAPVPATAPPDQFSAERAFTHIREIARSPHPLRSAEHERVRDYLVNQFHALGFQTGIQKTTVTRSVHTWWQAATVENVIATDPTAPTNGPLLLLTAHYDSHTIGPGAGDDASGVATLLETARALRARPVATPKASVAFLITDGEEYGLLGAQAFVNEAPQLLGGRLATKQHDIIVLNFEARGGGGPTYMFETSDGNGTLIDALGSVSRPAASSLTYALYKKLPNDTDLTVFKEAGMRGLNFAFAGKWGQYHTALDMPENLDHSSVQHHGTYALSLVRQLQSHWAEPTTTDTVYFDVGSRWLIHYPMVFVWPLTAFATGFYLFIFRARKGEPGVVGAFFAGLIAMPVTVLLCGLLSLGAVTALEPFRDGTPFRDTYAPRWFELSLFFLLVAGATAIWIPLLRRFRSQSLILGALFWWVVGLIAVSLLLPGASFFFLVPLLSSLLALQTREVQPILGVIAAIPVLVICVPISHGIALLLGFGLPPVFGILCALGLVPLLPALRNTYSLAFWPVLPLALLTIGSLGMGIWRSQGPKVDSLVYVMDSQNRTAHFATQEKADDVWLEPLFHGTAQYVEGNTLLPWLTVRYRVVDAPVEPLPGVAIVRSGDTLTVVPRRPSQEIIISTDRPPQRAMFGGKVLETGEKPLCFRYLAPPDSGFSLTITATPGTVVTVTEYTPGLPSLIPPRPPEMIARPISPATDVTITQRHLRW